MDAAHEELNQLLSQKPEEPVAETPQAPVATQPTIEQIEYYLGDKANKLPMNAEINLDGKRAPLSTILNHYRQRDKLTHDFSEFKKTKEQFALEQKEWGDLTPYRQLQKWSTEKPEEFNAIWELYQNRDKHLLGAKAQDPNSQALVNELMSLKQELTGLKEFKSQFDLRQQQEQDQKNIAELEAEVQEFKKEFPEVNLDQESDMVLDSGNKATLKQAIMLFGYKHGIPDFESAALKYLKPKLLEIASSRARKETVNAVKKDKEQGVMYRSSTPVMGQGSKVNPKLSWNDATKAAKAELEALLRG